jgi:hypothetical protein
MSWSPDSKNSLERKNKMETVLYVVQVKKDGKTFFVTDEPFTNEPFTDNPLEAARLDPDKKGQILGSHLDLHVNDFYCEGDAAKSRSGILVDEPPKLVKVIVRTEVSEEHGLKIIRR